MVKIQLEVPLISTLSNRTRRIGVETNPVFASSDRHLLFFPHPFNRFQTTYFPFPFPFRFPFGGRIVHNSLFFSFSVFVEISLPERWVKLRNLWSLIIRIIDSFSFKQSRVRSIIFVRERCQLFVESIDTERNDQEKEWSKKKCASSCVSNRFTERL